LNKSKKLTTGASSRSRRGKCGKPAYCWKKRRQIKRNDKTLRYSSKYWGIFKSRSPSGRRLDLISHQLLINYCQDC